MAVDAGPHATPDQVRAAEKRAAAASVGGDVEAARSDAPKGRRSKAEADSETTDS